jgi:(1->4)-alpha-D-glucan 1-alpha-D-glucosylmutase
VTQETGTSHRAPTSTYRVQVSKACTLGDVERLVPYFDALGIGAVYLSPCLRARPGSPHGYDIVDHNQVDPDLGGQPAFESLARALATRGIGLVVDFVPNHMAADASANHWWAEVLENGGCSPYADFFGIDWNPLKPEIEGRLLLPILGDQYGAVLERGELKLAFEQGRLIVRYFEHRLPVTPRSAPMVLRLGLDRLSEELGEEHPDLRELLSILTGLDHLPPFTETDPERIAERSREKEVLRERLARLVDRSPVILRHVRNTVAHANGTIGHPSSFDLLHQLLELQVYRLAYWRTASHEINYRRFFDINELAGLRVEREEVFVATHGWLAATLHRKLITGVRVDHPDGLYDPERYFERLRSLGPTEWVVGEKILTGSEELRATWPVDGTTGYGFLVLVNGLFVSPEGAIGLGRTYRRFTGRLEPFDEISYESKKLIMDTAMSSELNVLADALNRLSELDRRSRDFTLNALRDALAEVVACFPVYRTYVSERGWIDEDRRIIATAIRLARIRNPAIEGSIFSFIEGVLLPAGLGENHGPSSGAIQVPSSPERIELSMKMQQYTSPVEAKGVEDTAFYRYIPLLSVNEVGGDPTSLGRTVADFHEANQRRLRQWPLDMLATSTHDTKLGEDTRVRIDVLSQVPDRWRQEVFRWMRATSAARAELDTGPAPDRNDVYRLFQALVGCWPAEWTGAEMVTPEFVSRLQAYMCKAAREAKLHTSWVNQGEEYEAALDRFVERVLTGAESRRFVPQLVAFLATLAPVGMVNALAQLTLKLTSPGVPDIYQGTELWTLTLVDPDNRRPVDFGRREALVAELEPLLVAAAGGEHGGAVARDAAARVADLARNWHDGRIKMLVMAAGLRLRRAHPDLFLHGDYVPLDVEHADFTGELVAFARVAGGRAVIVVAPRRLGRSDPMSGAESWGAARIAIPDQPSIGAIRNILTGEPVAVVREEGRTWIRAGAVLNAVPVALLWATP